jgi:hypothetical protein
MYLGNADLFLLILLIHLFNISFKIIHLRSIYLFKIISVFIPLLIY